MSCYVAPAAQLCPVALHPMFLMNSVLASAYSFASFHTDSAGSFFKGSAFISRVVPGVIYCVLAESFSFTPARNAFASSISGLMLSAWRHSDSSFP